MTRHHNPYLVSRAARGYCSFAGMALCPGSPRKRSDKTDTAIHIWPARKDSCMDFERAYKRLALISLGLACAFFLLFFSGKATNMESGIMTLLLIAANAGWVAFFSGAWLYAKARHKASISPLYGGSVGILFALWASLVCIMCIKVDLGLTLTALGIAFLLCLGLYAGPALLFPGTGRRTSPLRKAAGAIILGVSLLGLFLLALP